MTKDIKVNAKIVRDIKVNAEMTKNIKVNAEMAKNIKVNAEMARDIKVNAEMAKNIKVKAILGQTVVKITQGGFPYTDKYIIDPDFNGIILETKDKYLVQNIKINPIKVESVSNLSGGRTVYIGGNINYG